jgi:transcriptional regulator with XRE-family HTH domain
LREGSKRYILTGVPPETPTAAPPDSVRKNPLGPSGSIAAQRVRQLREERSWTFKELSDRLGAIGRPIPTLGLRKIEREDRRIDVDDLIGLAVVFGVNPSTLLLPPRIDGEVEITAVGVVPAARAWAWVDGQAPLLVSADDDGSADVEFQLRARPPRRRRLRATTEAGRRALADELEHMGLAVARDDTGGVRAAWQPPEDPTTTATQGAA